MFTNSMETVAIDAAKVITPVVVNNIFDYVKTKVNNLIDKAKLINNYLDYYSKISQKMDLFKTFLFDTNTVSFTNVYYPLFIKKRNDNVSKAGDLLSILLSIHNPRIVIIGPAGSGKTMLTNHVFLTALRKNIMPIIIEFRKIGINISISDYIKKTLLDYGDSIVHDDVVFNSILQSGLFLFIFDGYDEIKSSELEERIDDLEQFTDKFNKNYFILTSRTDANTDAKAERLKSFDTYDICNLSKDDINPFIDKQCKYLENGDSLAKEIKEKIGAEKIEYAYNEYFKNPLLLSLFIKTFNRFPELPKSKCEFYRNIFETLWSTHDSIVHGGGYQHPRYYDQGTYEIILNNFCYNSYCEQDFYFNKDQLFDYLKDSIEQIKIDNIEPKKVMNDLTTSISILFRDGDKYSFPHRSLQEYFSAKYIQSLSPENNKDDFFYSDARKLFFDKSDHDFLLSLLSEIDKYCFKKYFLSRVLVQFLIKNDENISKCLCSKANAYGLIDSQIIQNATKLSSRMLSFLKEVVADFNNELQKKIYESLENESKLPILDTEFGDSVDKETFMVFVNHLRRLNETISILQADVNNYLTEQEKRRIRRIR